MTEPLPSRWGQLKQKLPTAVAIICGISFMNAKDAAAAGLFGSLVVLGLAWTIYQAKRVPPTLGEPVMTLGHMTALGPIRMTPWAGLAVIMFAFLGIGSFFSLADAAWQLRFGMPLVIFSIVGTFLMMLHRKLRKFGMTVFGVGFLAAGLLFAWASVDVIRFRQEGWALEAAKSAVFAAFVLLPGIATVSALLIGGGRTPIYEAGIAGPHGFVHWKHAERMELIESDGCSVLAVGAYAGWTLLIDVADEQRDEVTSLIGRVHSP